MDIRVTYGVGRYFFYGACALSLGFMVGVTSDMFGFPEEMATSLVLPVAFFAFMTLRDMGKNSTPTAVADKGEGQ